MKYFRKFGSLLLAAVMILSLAACGSKGSSNDTPAQTPSNDASAPAETPEEPAADGTGAASAGKVLVAYYSGSGNTKRVAETLADALNADLFEIAPVTPYTAEDLDWTVSDSRVNREHEDESLRDIALTQTTPENWDEYDTVFIGYPIWWGIAAWPVNNFVKDNDFTGKTVIPFCTSTSSGMGRSGELLAEMAGTGDWREGQRFSGSASGSDVLDWAEKPGL